MLTGSCANSLAKRAFYMQKATELVPTPQVDTSLASLAYADIRGWCGRAVRQTRSRGEYGCSARNWINCLQHLPRDSAVETILGHSE